MGRLRGNFLETFEAPLKNKTKTKLHRNFAQKTYFSLPKILYFLSFYLKFRLGKKIYQFKKEFVLQSCIILKCVFGDQFPSLQF